MLKREKDELIINAIAVYICFYSKKNNVFLPEVDIHAISELVGANYTIQGKAKSTKIKLAQYEKEPDYWIQLFDSQIL